ncbi:MAG: quinol:electron acceptor oxidoreductase subunit ActD, partial [Longimicrobiales bacterium]
LGVCRLYPGKRACPPTDRVTDDHFVLVIEESDASFNVSRVKETLEEFNVVELEERVVPAGGHTS